jgi:hypothetical protein
MVASIFSGVAALAALLTVYYARSTVTEARKARQEARQAHGEEMDREGQLLTATVTAHDREMAERERALERELWLQRLTQLGKVQDIVKETADIARYEVTNRPERIEGGIGTWTRVTGGLLRLEAAIVVLERLGGPELPEMRQTARDGRRMGNPPGPVVGAMMDALARLLHLSEQDASFQPPSRGEKQN